MSDVEGRTDMLLKRADLQRFYQFSGTDWLMCEPIDRRVRVSCCTWLSLGLWPMTALRQERPLRIIIPETLDQPCRKPRETGTLTSASLIASSSRSIATYSPCQYASAALHTET
jgi:hypothetical protein